MRRLLTVMKMQKRLIVLFFLLLAGCSLETKTLFEFYEEDLDDVIKIELLDGSTGYKKVIIDKTVIDNFLDEIRDIQFIPEENQEKRDGFRYSITLFQDEDRTFSFTLNEVNDHYYYTQPDIHPVVDDFYKNLDVQEE
jgi:hypothetical protein